MKIFLSSYALVACSAMVSASPLHRHRNGVRHAIELEKRYVVNGLFTEPVSPEKRHERSAENNEAQQTQTVSSINPFAVPTRQGTEDGRAPAVGVGGSNTSLLSLLTQDITVTATARAQPSTPGQNAQQNGAPAAGGSGTAINPAGAAAVSITTVQIETTVLETVQVTVQATAAALSSVTAPVGEAPASSERPQQPAAQSAEPEAPTTVSVVFVTAGQSSSAPSTELTTLDTAENTATASDVIAAATTTTTALAALSTETIPPPQPTTADAPIANSQLLGLGEDRTSTTTLASTTTEVIAATAAAAQESSAINTSAPTSTSSEAVAATGTEPATVTIRPGLGSIPATEARPATLSTDSAAPSSTAANPLATAAPEQPSDSVTLAVVPVTIETAQQNQNAFTVTETQTVTTTVTAV